MSGASRAAPARAHVRVADAFERIFLQCMAAVASRRTLLLLHPESRAATHDMRVAVRRVRSALSFFKPALQASEAEFLKREAKWISDALGAARDADFFMTAVERAQRSWPDLNGLEALATQARQRAGKSHRALRAALESARFERFEGAAPRFAREGDWRRDPTTRALLNEDFRSFATRVLTKRTRKIAARKGMRAARGDDERKRHRQRIRAKKLRYMAQFAAPFLAGGRMEREIRLLRKIQSSLGAAHDEAARAQALDAILPCEAARMTLAGGLAMRPASRSRDAQVARAVKTLSKLKKVARR